MNRGASGKSNSALPMCVGLGVVGGTVIGLLTDEIGLWMPIGVAIGSGLGVALSAHSIDGSDHEDKVK